MSLALALTTIVGMIAGTTALVRTATGIGMIEDIVATDLGHLPVAPNMMTVVRPGLRPPGGRLMIKGLQGTNQNDVGTTGDATRKMSATTIGRGTQTAMADGRVEWILVR